MSFTNHDPREKPQIVSISGGRASGYLMRITETMAKKYGWNVHFVFMDTGGEAPETYAFIRHIVEHWNINLTVFRADIHPELVVGALYSDFYR